jgi:8-oxo-dGTP pyrophosphatase MutT (NUDIX family)
MSAFKNFVSELQEKLGSQLPGPGSQLKMAPVTRLLDLERNRSIEVPRKSAVLVLFYPDKDKTKLLLIKRALDETVHSGQISFPGGKYEKPDKDLKTTALREAHEEIGIEPKQVTLIGSLSKLYIPPSNFDVYPFVGFLEEKPQLNGNHEVQRILKIDFDELRKPETCVEKTILHRTGKEVMVPSYAIQDEIIWGATAMILSELLEITKGI